MHIESWTFNGRRRLHQSAKTPAFPRWRLSDCLKVTKGCCRITTVGGRQTKTAAREPAWCGGVTCESCCFWECTPHTSGARTRMVSDTQQKGYMSADTRGVVTYVSCCG